MTLAFLSFSTIASPLNELLKKDISFEWGERQQKAFDDIMTRLTQALILALPNFEKMFELECDASRVEIGAVLLQEGHPIAYFSGKLNGPSRNYLMSAYFCPHLMFNFGYLIEFVCLKSDLIDNFDNYVV